ncbi:MAG: hypothetical protein JNL98_04315 [Bryobacterales bacterium]|nr:hypothetical protein [Bryobacterales bacterium]
MLPRATFAWTSILLLSSLPIPAQPTIGGCPVLPADNIWNTPIDHLPVMSNSSTLVTTIGASAYVHPDFGSGTYNGGPIGIPFLTVPGTQTKYPATFLYSSESDPGPYAVPLDAPIEGGSQSNGDRHAIAIDTTNCILYELYRAFPQTASWRGDSGAIYNLRSNALRPAGWTSADAAGLPIMPGLVTWEEVASGEIRHAIRFTVPQTRRAYVWPARHYASSLTGTQYPPMGQRFRLKASFDISTFPAEVQVILRAMKKYGIILADNGSAWYISGKPDSRWNNDNLRTLRRVTGSNFEAVDATVLMIDPNSGQARQNGVTVTVSPSSATLHVGKPQQFAANVQGATNTAVTWSVSGVAGGNTVVGLIDATGRYVAPTNPPSPANVTVQATSVAAPTVSGAASVTVLPLPNITSVSPSPITVGSFTLTVNGVGFLNGSQVSFAGAPIATTFVSSNQLRATGSASAPATNVPVTVYSPDNLVSNTVTVNVVAPAVTISISPPSASLRRNRTLQFTATVQGTTNTAVVWKVNGVTGGNATVGTISTTGLYRSPLQVPSTNPVTVTAQSVADTAKTASATVSIRR